MNRFVRKFSFVALMVIVAVSLSGCKLDISKIGDFVGKIGKVVSKIGDFLQNLGSKIKENADKGETPANSAVPPSTTPPPSDTTTTAPTTGQNPVIEVPGTPTSSPVVAPTADEEAKLVQDAVTKYNKDHAVMINKIDKETLEKLVAGGYLKKMPANPEKLGSSGDLTSDGKVIRVETKPATPSPTAATTGGTPTTPPQTATKETGTPATSNNPNENPYGTTGGPNDPGADVVPDNIRIDQVK